MSYIIMPLSDFNTPSDATSLGGIGEKPFTVVKVEDSEYRKDDKVTPGVLITTKEEFEIDGNKYKKFYTTRTVVVQKLKEPKLVEAINSGTFTAPIKCIKPAGKGYFVLEDA